MKRYLRMPDAEPDAPILAVQQIRTRRDKSGDENVKPRKESATSTMGGTSQLAVGAGFPSKYTRPADPDSAPGCARRGYVGSRRNASREGGSLIHVLVGYVQSRLYYRRDSGDAQCSAIA